METAIKIPTQWNNGTIIQQQNQPKLSIYNKWTALEDAQAGNKTMWYLVSMVAQGVFFLPVPAYLIFYYNAPVMLVAVTMVLFFANLIAGMAGYGTRVLMSVFLISILTHIAMLLVYVL